MLALNSRLASSGAAFEALQTDTQKAASDAQAEEQVLQAQVILLAGMYNYAYMICSMQQSVHHCLAVS